MRPRIVLGIPGVVLMDFVDSGIECWIVFAYRGAEFSIYLAPRLG